MGALAQQRAKPRKQYSPSAAKQYAPSPQFTVVNAPGGSYQVYPNGQRRFVPAGPPKVRDLMVGGAGGGARPSPYKPDAEYYTTIAQQRFKRQQQMNQMGQQSAYDRNDYQEALRRLHEQHPRDIQTTRQSAAREGLFYSGQLGKREGDVNTDYARREGDARQGLERREAARKAARRALQAGGSIEEAAALAESIDRQIDRDSIAAAAGILGPNPGAARSGRRKRPTFRGRRVRDLNG